MLGAHWAALLVAVATWGSAARLAGLGRIVGLAAAPIALTTTIPVAGFDWRIIAAALVAMLALVPLFPALGPGWPSARAALTAGGALVTAAVFLATPPGAVLAASELVPGAVTLGLAAGVVAFGFWRIPHLGPR